MKAELVLGNLRREREALNSKLQRLEDSLSKDWQDTDQEYLCTQQYNAMCLYAHILDERIIDIECKLEEKKAEAQEAKLHEIHHDVNDRCDYKTNTESCKDSVSKFCDDEDAECDEYTICNTIKDLIKEIFGEDVIVYYGHQQ